MVLYIVVGVVSMLKRSNVISHLQRKFFLHYNKNRQVSMQGSSTLRLHLKLHVH